MKQVSILFPENDLSFNAILYENRTSEAFLSLLPIKERINVWGGELYFPVNMNVELESDAHSELDFGEMAYWPNGPYLCIFFGKTPASVNDKPTAISPVSLIGKIDGPLDRLFSLKTNSLIQITINHS